MGPAPTTATTSPGLHLAVEHADLVAGGEDVGEHQDLLVGHADGAGVGGGVDEGHADQLGLGAVDRVARGSSRRRRGTARSGPRGSSGRCRTR